MPIPVFMMGVWSGLKKVWLWLKKYWMWLLFPVGIVVFFLGRWTKSKPPDVVVPELLGAADKKLEEDAKAREAAERAKAERDRMRDEVLREHYRTIERLSEKQQDKVDELVDDPEALNEFLLSVGREMRDE